MFFYNFRKNILLSILLLILLLILAYTTNITSIPNNIILFQEEKINLVPIFGVKLEEAIPVDAKIKSNSGNNKNVEEKKYNLSLLGFNLKTITADVLPITKVKPLGNIVGLKLYTKGVLVVGTSQIEGEDKKLYKPYEI